MQLSAAVQAVCVVFALIVVVVAGKEGSWYSDDGSRAIMQRMIAFPRMGRANSGVILSWPRNGRSEVESASEAGEGCCPVGLRLEWSHAEGGKLQVTRVCEMEAGCCPGLEEVVRRNPTGGFYSMCLAPTANS